MSEKRRTGPAGPSVGTAPVVDTLLLGFGLSSDQGSIGFCGVYLVTSGPRRILFDCGHAGRRRALHRALADRGLNVRDIDTLVLSHGHYDHIQNADLFAHADVLLHRAESDHLAAAPLDDPATPPWSGAILRSLSVREATDGLEIAPGVTVTGLPGHTAGSTGLTVETVAGTALLTGDAVSSARALRSGRCTSVSAGEDAAARSMEHVRAHADLVYPGHDRPFTGRGPASRELRAPSCGPGPGRAGPLDRQPLRAALVRGAHTDRRKEPVTMTIRTDRTDDSATGVFVEPAPVFSPTRLREVLAEHWGLTNPRLSPLDAERDLNLRVDDRLVLKIANPAERADVVDMEVRARAHVLATDPSLPIPASVATRAGTWTADLRDDTGRSCLARLITFLPGAALEGRELDLGLAEQVGAVAGRMSVALGGFFHPAAGRTLMWDIRRMPSVLAESGITDSRWHELAARVAPALEATVTLPSSVQHADVTLTNVLTEADALTGVDTVSAVIDFGDLHHTAAVCDLAVTLTSVLRGAAGDDLRGLWRLTDAVLRGYQRHRALTSAEASLLGELVIARLLTTLAVSSARRGRHRDNFRYITQYDQNSERVLGLLSTLGPDALADRMRRLAGTPEAAGSAPDPSLPGRRARSMGGALSPLFYREPLELSRGEGPWLYATDGTRYLDAYNNVPVVGHAHPAVTNAVSSQLATLNTHSRYLHPGIVGLAERILETMPPGLDTCLFTTSGTEANELAWRLATEYTDGDAAIVAEHAYHGSSKWMADLSSNEWPEGYRPRRVATFEAAHGPAEDLTRALAVRRVGQAAAALRAADERPALVLADSQFTSEGILDVPDEFLGGLLDGAHAVDALFLADEVQSGYGRSGPLLWRFARAGITPDIVTLGKPMGAGYPIGAVVTRREIADVLAGKYEYFSTFAATPAAAAAGHAVLDVLQLTGLPAQAVEVGARLRARLRTLAADEPLLGEVRGTGLLAGIDVAPLGGATSRETARSLLESLVGRGVLVGLTGPRGDVLKVRPPLVWEAAHVDLFIDRLHQSLADLRA